MASKAIDVAAAVRAQFSFRAARHVIAAGLLHLLFNVALHFALAGPLGVEEEMHAPGISYRVAVQFWAGSFAAATANAMCLAYVYARAPAAAKPKTTPTKRKAAK